MRIPNPEKIPEHLKDMIYDDYGIDVDMHTGKFNTKEVHYDNMPSLW